MLVSTVYFMIGTGLVPSGNSGDDGLVWSIDLLKLVFLFRIGFLDAAGQKLSLNGYVDTR